MNAYRDKLIVVRPLSELPGRTERLESVLEPALEEVRARGVTVELAEKVSDLRELDLRGKRVIFAISLSEAGINLEYYRLLEYFRMHTGSGSGGGASDGCLQGAVGGIIVDGAGELYTKALARRLAFSANMAGCTFPGKPLVEATGSLGNFGVLSGITGKPPFEVYRDQVKALVSKVLEFDYPDCGDRINVLAVHASSRATSNTLLLWDMVKAHIADRADVTEISLRNGDLLDCRGCSYETCRHFGEQGECFYGGVMTEQAFPAILAADALVMICPNYNDAMSANLTAFVNRLTALFRVHDFTKKRVYALVISGYSGGDIVAEQVIGAFNFNKAFILPGGFAMTETANDPKSILRVSDIDHKAELFASRIR